jgi:transcriptional regulator with XRE-family HTH domain
VPGQITRENLKSFDQLSTDREVTRCATCGLVQFMTRRGRCRQCVRLLPQRVEFLFRSPKAAQTETDNPAGGLANSAIVESIGQRIRQLRESRGLTQKQLQSQSKVSRSYISRIESGQMTPSLGTLEKISAALNVGLKRFFIPESDGEDLFQDPFIQGLCQLDWHQWQSILKRLQAIGDHVGLSHPTPGPIGKQAMSRRDAASNNNIDGHIGTGHSNGAALVPSQRAPKGYLQRRPLGPTFHKPNFSKL